MDERLRKALDFSNFRHTFSIQRKILKEKNEARLTYGYGGGVFKIDMSLITFVDMLINNGRKNDVPLLDSNDNPILINDLEEFKNEILDRYFTATLEYYKEYEKVKKTRSLEKLLEL
jgi:hypothetical protein